MGGQKVTAGCSLILVAAALFGADAKSEMDQDLNRMKTMIETGTPAHDAAAKEQPLYTH